MICTDVVLEDGVVKLVPFTDTEDYEYLYELAGKYKYNAFTRREMEANVFCFGLAFWLVYGHGYPVGCAFLNYYRQPNMYTFDAFKDDEFAKTINNKGDYSYRTAKLLVPYILNHITPALHMAFDIRNRPARMIAKRLGFKPHIQVKTNKGNFNIYKKERG